jgi:hypothetical protein
MLRSRQLFNHIRRYNHSHSPSHKNLDNTLLESKNDKIMFQLESIDFLLKCNYAMTIISVITSVFK